MPKFRLTLDWHDKEYNTIEADTLESLLTQLNILLQALKRRVKEEE